MRTDLEGHVFPPASFRIEPGKVEEFLTALHVLPYPGYEARQGLPVPPGYLMYVVTYGADPVHETLEIDFRRAMYGGADITYLAPILVGDELVVSPRVGRIALREGSAGKLTLAEIICEYHRANQPVAVERSTTIERS